ncbi:MAG: hybrid sensor histidine kinase/response regulator [Actinomycetota bacterium]
MDSSLSPELIDMYHGEVAERSERLAAGARQLAAGRPAPETVADMIRHGHTIKGSSRVMGLVEMGHAGALLEYAWKRIESGDLTPNPTLGQALEQLAIFLPDAAAREAAGESVKLRAAVARTEATIQGISVTAIQSPTAPARAYHEPVTLEGGPTSLGGLLAEVERSMMTGVSRVDTIDLYQLINQAVEVSLDSEALSDLALVQFEGADPQRLMSAWRLQLRRMAAAVGQLQDLAVALANAPLRQTTETFPQFVRYVGRKLGKEVRFSASGEDIEFDRQIVELMREPLRHVLVNAVDHGLEPPEERIAAGKPGAGAVTLAARREGEKVVVVISDDGRGIDWKSVQDAAQRRGLPFDQADLNALLFLPGFSTAEQVHDFSGAGDGLSTVSDVLERVNGTINLESSPGVGTSVTMILPVSLVLQSVVVVADGDNFWGLPEAAVQSSMVAGDGDISPDEHGILRVRFQSSDVPVVDLAKAMGQEKTGPAQDLVIVSTRSGPVAVAVGEVLGRRRVAVKALGPILGGSRNITGAALLGGGEVMVVVDPHYLGEFARQLQPHPEIRRKVLVVDDSAGVRQLLSATLSGRGFEVEVAPNAREAVLSIASGAFDALIVDFAMPRTTGVDLVRALRAGGLKLPIVMVSGVASAAEQAAAWSAGVDAYLDKSDLRLGALAATLRSLIDGPFIE